MNNPNTSPEQILMNAVTESCAAKTILSSVAGFGMGGLFGMFMSSVDTNHPTIQAQYATMTTRQQMVFTIKDMGSKSYSTAKNFAVVGALFAGTECIIETYRGRNDVWNGVSAGFITGGILSCRAGPQAMLFGSVGFAVFSAGIDYYIRYWS